MKKSTFFIIIAICVFSIQCKKFADLKDNDPTANPSYLYGRLTLLDTLSQNAIGIPLSGKTVTVSYSDVKDTLNFLYSTTTDADGYFKFNTLNSKKTYILRYQENTLGKIILAKSGPISLPKDSLSLIAHLDLSGQTGFVIKVVDNQGHPVNNADVCVSTSIIPYNNSTCDGSQYSLKSDANGHASQIGIRAGTYYLYSKTTINNVQYSGKLILTVKDTIVSAFNVQLNGPAPVSNQLTVYLVDQNKKPINGGQICLFSSKTLFARDTCEGSNYSVGTDPTGRGSFSNLTPGKYYILGQLALTNFRLLGRDSISINQNVLLDTIYLK